MEVEDSLICDLLEAFLLRELIMVGEEECADCRASIS